MNQAIFSVLSMETVLVSYEKYFDTFSKNLRITIYNFIKIPNRKSKIVNFHSMTLPTYSGWDLVLKCFCNLVGYKLGVAPHGKQDKLPTV